MHLHIPVVFLLLRLCLAQDNKKTFTVTLKERPSESEPTNQKSVKISGSLECADDTCTYQLTIQNLNSDFFNVLVDSKTCNQNSCEGSFSRHQIVNVTVTKPGFHLDIFDFEYVNDPNVIVLGCRDGFYNEGDCTRGAETVTNGHHELDYFDEVCVCSNTAQQDCTDQSPKESCKIPQWWIEDSTFTSVATTETTVLSTSISTKQPKIEMKSTIYLSEVPRVAGNPTEERISVTAVISSCNNDYCDYRTDIVTTSPNYFVFFVERCSQTPCVGTIEKGKEVTVIVKRQGKLLNLLEFQYYTNPNIAVLGCKSGLLLPDSCTRKFDSPQVNDIGYADTVCSCNSDTLTCTDLTQIGVCIGGTEMWWTDDISTSSSSTTTKSGNVKKADILLSENKMGEAEVKNIRIEAELSCDVSTCHYTATVTTESPDYYTVVSNGIDCIDSLCTGKFSSGQSVPVIVKRLGQHLEIIAFEYDYEERITVLGCKSGLIMTEKCSKTAQTPIVQGVYYNDTLCSCPDENGSCNKETVNAQCETGAYVWWIDDPIDPIESTSTPLHSNIYDFSIQLSEGDEYSDPSKLSNVTIGTFLNCSAILCQYSITTNNNSPENFVVKVNLNECPKSHCSGSLSQGDITTVKVYRMGEILDLFDMDFTENTPKVIVLGCSSGLLKEGKCFYEDFFDSTIQKHDNICICQSTSNNCDVTTEQGKCENNEQPTWWQKYDNSVNVSLSEFNGKANPNSDKNISLSAHMTCDEYSCNYQITVQNGNKNYYSVYINGASCGDKCESTFGKIDSVTVTIHKVEAKEYMNVLTLKYADIQVLDCTNGLFTEDRCNRIENSENGLTQQMCICQDTAYECSSDVSPVECSSGPLVWWHPDGGYSTSTTKEPTQRITEFTLKLDEQNNYNGNDHAGLFIDFTIQCDEYSCNYDLVVNDLINFSLKTNGKLWDPKNAVGSVTPSNPFYSVTLERSGQYLTLIELVYGTVPTVSILGCERTVPVDLVGPGPCLQANQQSSNFGNYYSDSVCFCGGKQSKCDEDTITESCYPNGLVWWQDNPTSSQTTEITTTTYYDVRNEFSVGVLLVEEVKQMKNSLKIVADTQKKKIKVDASMSCSLEECGYSINITNLAPDYFTVLVNNVICLLNSCEGSFVKGKSVNVTVFRDDQHVDLMDFEFTDIPRVVVLGCENGLVEYNDCLKTTQTGIIGENEFTDEVCSCRSVEMDCEQAKNGICVSGSEKWWKDNDYSSTSSPTTTTVFSPTPESIPSLKNISDSGVGLNNVTQVLNDTYQYSSQGVNLNRTQIFEISKILTHSANLPGISSENAYQILQNMDECLNAHEDELRNGQSKEYRLLEVLKPMVRNTKDSIINYLQGNNMGFGAKKVDCSNIDSDDGLIDYGPEKGFSFLNDTNKLSSTRQNSIIVPLTNICGDQEISHVFFTIYRHQKLFNGPQTYRVYGGKETNGMNETENRMRVRRNSNKTDSTPLPPPSKCDEQISIPFQSTVMSATVMSKEDTIRTVKSENSSPIMAKLQFNLNKMKRPLHGQTVVSWFNTGYQKWDLEEKCKVISDKDGILTATCEHLTDFSALVYGQVNAEYVCSFPLILIGYIVNGISILCLILLITIGIMFYLRSDVIIKILTFVRGQAPKSGDIVNLTYYSVFFIFFILLLFFMNDTDTDETSGDTSTYCVIIAALSYCSLISAILMSMLIGIRMISHFFTPRLRVFFGVMTSPPAALSIGLAVPIVFTLCIAILDTDFFRRDDAFCWVRPDFVVYAVVIPVVLPIINGVICSSFAIYKMFFQAKRGLANRETSHYDAEFWSKVVGLIIMQVAMGLPWGIEFIIIGVSGPSPWNYIFVILIGSQGIDLFLIFLYRRQRLLAESKKWSGRSKNHSKTRAKAATFMSER